MPGIEGRRACSRARGDGGARSSSVGQSLDDRDETLADLVASFAIGGPIAVLLASLLGYALAAAGLRPVEAMRRRAQEVSLSRDGRAAAAAGGARRDPPARRDAQRDARPPAPLVRARAPLRRRRQPRAAHAGGGHQGRARGRAARRRARPAGARGARRRGRGVRPPRAAGRGPAGRRARGRGRAARAARAARRCASCSSASRERFADRAGERGRAIAVDAGDAACRRTPTRCGCARRSATSSTTRCATAQGEIVLRARGAADGGVELEVSDEGAGFDPDFAERAFERFARGDAPARATAPASAWRSCARSPRRTAAGPRSSPGAGATVRIWLPTARNRLRAISARRRSFSAQGHQPDTRRRDTMRDKLKGALIAVAAIAALAVGGAAIAGAAGGGDDDGTDKAITGAALDRAERGRARPHRRRQGHRDRGRRRGGRLRGRGDARRRQPGRRPPRQGLQRHQPGRRQRRAAATRTDVRAERWSLIRKRSLVRIQDRPLARPRNPRGLRRLGVARANQTGVRSAT